MAGEQSLDARDRAAPFPDIDRRSMEPCTRHTVILRLASLIIEQGGHSILPAAPSELRTGFDRDDTRARKMPRVDPGRDNFESPQHEYPSAADRGLQHSLHSPRAVVGMTLKVRHVNEATDRTINLRVPAAASSCKTLATTVKRGTPYFYRSSL
jgi:hypothetical protein